MPVQFTCLSCGAINTCNPARTKKYCSNACKYARTPEERFWSKVNRDGPIQPHRPELGACWIWAAHRFKTGYGSFGLNNTMVYTHRLSYEWANGPIPSGLWVLHHCDNPPCVRPSHLFLGTHTDNMHDMDQKGRRVILVGEEASRHGHLTTTDIRNIRALSAKQGMSHRKIARLYGIDYGYVGRIVRRQKWKHVE